MMDALTDEWAKALSAAQSLLETVPPWPAWMPTTTKKEVWEEPAFWSSLGVISNKKAKKQ
jgi:hypothetical protein